MKTLTLIPAQASLLAQAEAVNTQETVAAAPAEETAATVDNTVTEIPAGDDTMQQPRQPEQPSSASFWIMLLVMGLIFWFFIIRPNSKRQKAIQKFQNSLTVGTQVYTQGGIVGKVVGINEAENTIKIEVSRDVTITVFRSCVFSSATPQQ